MNIQNLEREYRGLILRLRDEKSPRISLYLLNKFLSELIPFDDPLIYESYFIEFIQEYIYLIRTVNIVGLPPLHPEEILNNAKILMRTGVFTSFQNELAMAINILEINLLEINKILRGEDTDTFHENITGISFPVIEKHPFEGEFFGTIEYLKIRIHKGGSIENDNFIVIPSQEKLERKLSDQISTSWKIAKGFCGNEIKKMFPYHEIIITFNRKYGNIVGESLGVALTLGFIEQLHKLYNLPIDITVNTEACFTGGIDDNFKVKPVSNEIIKVKTETVFFSCKKIFAVPKPDEEAAKETLGNLKKKYPGRNLKLIPIEDLEDIINRRNLINIEKQSITTRSFKVLKKRGVSAALTLILLVILGFNLLKYLDKNPARIIDENRSVIVENKYGEVLFEKKATFYFTEEAESHTRQIKRRFIDIDDDGRMELLILQENLKGTPEENKTGRLACYNNYGNLIWEYILTEKVETPRQSFSRKYVLKNIIGVIEENGTKVIYVCGQNIIYFPSPFIRIDARTGERLEGILWHPGGMNSGIIGDFNKDGKTELVACGVNNGLERAVVFSINTDELKHTTRAPSIQDYSFNGFKVAKFNKYILFPKTDYNMYKKLRFNNSLFVSFNKLNNKFYATTLEGDPQKNIVGLGFYFDNNLSNPEILIGDIFQVRRDSLVVKGKIKGKLTNTKEYEKSLMEQFEEWNSHLNSFVKMKRKKL